MIKNCKNLEEVDLTPLMQLRRLGQYFLSHCVILEDIYLPPRDQFEEIGNHFLNRCERIRPTPALTFFPINQINDNHNGLTNENHEQPINGNREQRAENFRQTRAYFEQAN